MDKINTKMSKNVICVGCVASPMLGELLSHLYTIRIDDFSVAT